MQGKARDERRRSRAHRKTKAQPFKPSLQWCQSLVSQLSQCQSGAVMVSPPEILEWSGAQFGVARGVLDVGVTEPQLQSSGVVTGIGQEVATGVPQRMRM